MADNNPSERAQGKRAESHRFEKIFEEIYRGLDDGDFSDAEAILRAMQCMCLELHDQNVGLSMLIGAVQELKGAIEDDKTGANG